VQNKISKSQNINLGLIGAGNWGRNYIRTINKMDNVKLVSVLSNNPNTKKKVPKGCQIVNNIFDFLKIQNLDGAIVASPPNTHFKLAKKLIENNIPIIIEKPITTSLSEAENILAEAKSKNSIVFVDHIFLYHPTFKILKNFVKKKEKIKLIRGIGGNKGPIRKDVSSLWDWGPHDLSMCLIILDSMPLEIFAEKVEKNLNNIHCGENIKINLIFKNSIRAEFLVGNSFTKKIRKFSIEFNNEILEFTPFEKKSLIYKNISNKEALKIFDSRKEKELGKPPLNILVEEFCKSIRIGEQNIADLELSVKVINILEEIDKIIN